MSKFVEVLQIASYALSILVIVIVPFVIYVYKKIRELIAAKSPDEVEEILNDIMDKCIEFVRDAENSYKMQNEYLKKEGATAGKLKKENVLAMLKIECMNRGIEFNAGYWERKIYALVEMSKEVN